MDTREKYAIGMLENHTYRQLQKIAKAKCLPANVKRSCLIHLIHTKMFGTLSQVNAIIQEVKRDRQRCAQSKKKKRKMGLQGVEISSTSGRSERSPVISATPRRSSMCGPIYVRYSPILRRSLIKYTGNPTMAHQRSALPNALKNRLNVALTRLNTTITGPNTTITRPNTTVTGPNTTVTGPNTTVTGSNTTVTGPNTTITGPNATMTGPNTTVTRPNTTVTRPNTTLTRPNDTTSKAASSSLSNLAAALRTYPSPRKVPCDRVLRNRRYPIYSKTDVKKPQTYREVLDSNDRTIELIEKQNIQERSNQSLKIVDRNGSGQLKNQTTYKVQPKSLLQKHRPSILSGNSCPQRNVSRKLLVNTYRSNEDVIEGADRVQNASIEPQCSDLSPEIIPAKRQKRNISGIYPISTPKVAPQTPKTYEYVERGLGIRNRDGSYSKINAFVQKPLTGATKRYTNTNASTENYVQNIQKESNFDFTIQDIIDGNINSTAMTFQETGSYVGRYVDANYVNTYPVVQTAMTPIQNVDASYVTYPAVQTAMTPTQNVYASYLNTYPVLQTVMTPTQNVDGNYVNPYPVVQTVMTPTQNVDAHDVNKYPAVQAVMTPTQNTYIYSQRDMSSVVDTPVSMISHQSTELENLIRTGLGDDFNTTYCHKKIRSEHMRTGRESLHNQTSIREKELPRIHEVFSSFTNVAETISVQTANVDCFEMYNGRETSDTSMLETIVNFKSQFLTHQPLKQIQTRAVTRCVFTTATSATATPWDASTIENNNAILPADDSCVSNGTTRALLAATGSPQDNDQNNSGSTTASLELLAAQVGDMDSSPGTVSDMEDALEWISQDGDYMERMELDFQMQCMLCNWAGPKYSLEYHIRREHHNKIHKFESQEWNVTFSLSALLTSGEWHSEVIEGNLDLYVLSARAAQGTFRATLTTLSLETATAKSGTVTVYNAVSGEPHSWCGIIPSLPAPLPHESAASSELTVQLSELDVLPRSACDKVVYGPPDFGDIQITVFVKI